MGNMNKLIYGAIIIIAVSITILIPVIIVKQEPINPAIIYCQEQGYTYELKNGGDENQTIYCVFDDGTECIAEAYHNDLCEPGKIGLASQAAVFCIERGHNYVVETNPDKSQTAYCISDRGSDCKAWDYFNEECMVR